ncbi:MAG: hypothetical protein ACOC32_01300 [Nanoarchaeota archaeon]
MRIVKRIKRFLKRFFTAKMMMTLFIVVMLLGSVLGFVLTSGTNATNVTHYNGYKVQLVQNGYLIFYEDQQLNFFFSPQELESFNISDEVETALTVPPYIILSFDPDIEDVQTMENIRYNIFQHYQEAGKVVGFGMSEPNILLEDQFDVITCANSSASTPVIVMEDGERNTIEFDQATSCVTVTSQDVAHRMRFYEAISYRILGIIE